MKKNIHLTALLMMLRINTHENQRGAKKYKQKRNAGENEKIFQTKYEAHRQKDRPVKKLVASCMNHSLACSL